MRILTVLTLAAGIAAAAAGPATAAPLTDPIEAGRFTFGRDLVLPTPALTGASPIIAAGGLREGGLSSLQVVPGTNNRRFLSISDRGPNGQPGPAAGGRTFPSPGFAPLIYDLRADDDGTLAVVSRTPIGLPGNDPLRTGPDGATFPGDPKTITGFRNLAALGLDDNMYLQTSDNTIGPAFGPTDPYGLDTEGLQRDPRDGSYWLSEEYRPSIVHLSSTGVMLDRIVPAGSGAQDTDATAATVPLSTFYNGAAQPKLTEILPAEWKARRQNRGLEGIAISPDGTKLAAIMQNPLDTRNNTDIDPLTSGTQDLYKTFGYGESNGTTGGRCDGVTTGPENTGGAGSTNFYRNVRVGTFDITNPAAPVMTGEYIYRLELQSASDSTIQGRQRISDLAWVGPNTLLVDEHDDDALVATGTSTGRKLFEIDLSGATNLTTNAAYDTFAERATRIAGVGGHAGTQPIGCYLDGGTAAELAALPTPVAPVAKSAYLDIGSPPAGVGFSFNKVEGVALLEGVPAVALLNDNDFGFAQGDDLQIKPAADPTEQLRIYTTKPSGTAPTISGNAQVGQLLTCTPGTYGGTGTLQTSFEWLRGGIAIGGASASQLLTAADAGAAISCRVVGTRVSGPVRAVADPQTSAATTIAALSPYAAGVLADVPAGYWRFGEPSGTTALDSSGNLNHGTYLGGVTLGGPGALAGDVNPAASFDGVNDAVRVPDSASLDVGNVFTLEGWVKRSNATKSAELFNKGGNGLQLTWMNAANGGQIWLRKANVSTVARSAIAVPSDGAFHHVVVTKSGASTTIYVDAAPSTVAVSPAQVIANTTSPLTFTGAGAPAHALDEFALYGRALSPSEVGEHTGAAGSGAI